MLFAQGPVAAAAFYFIIMSAAKPPRAAIYLGWRVSSITIHSLNSPARSGALPKRQKAFGRQQKEDLEDS
jgi:hypothetical protein